MQENISVTDSYSTGNAAQAMLEKLLQIYDVKTLVAQLNGVGENHWSAAILKRALANDSAWHRLSEKEFAHLQTLLPKPPEHHPHYAFRFIDLFAGIGGIRRGFESIGGQCVFTSEWNKHAVRTYKANHYCDPATHHFNEDIRDITLSHQEGVSDEAAAEHIRQHIPEHDVLLAGFPCQPFSLAGVSKKNSLGRAHGFACDTQGTLFFDVVRIIDARRPAMFVLENVKNLVIRVRPSSTVSLTGISIIRSISCNVPLTSPPPNCWNTASAALFPLVDFCSLNASAHRSSIAPLLSSAGLFMSLIWAVPRSENLKSG